MAFQPGNPGGRMKRGKPDTRTQDEHYAPKPEPVEPHNIVLATELMVQPSTPPAVTVSRSVTRRAPDLPDVTAHREHARARAIQVFDAAFDRLVQLSSDETASGTTRMAALKFIIELSLSRDEEATETLTTTSHLDALAGLAMKPAVKQITKKPPEGGSF